MHLNKNLAVYSSALCSINFPLLSRPWAVCVQAKQRKMIKKGIPRTCIILYIYIMYSKWGRPATWA